VSPRFLTERFVGGLGGLFRRLLRRKAGPVVIAIPQGAPRMLEIGLRLPEPVPS
jgi:hypothetical protein